MLTGRKVEGALKKLFWALLGPDISPSIDNRHTWWGQQRSLNAREPARDMETSYHNFLWTGEFAAYGYAAAGSQACERPDTTGGSQRRQPHVLFLCRVSLQISDQSKQCIIEKSLSRGAGQFSRMRI